MGETPLVSVIIPVYNTEKYVVKSIHSALSQTYKNIEVIVVDDGSPDNSANLIIDEFGGDSRVKFFKKENGGVSSARNLALEVASGSYITFLDSDDTFEEHTVQALYNAIVDGNTDVSIPSVYNMISVTGEVRVVKLFNETKTEMDALTFAIDHMIIEGTAWRCSSVMYKSDVIKEHNVSFIEGVKLNEDYLFNLSYFSHISKVSIVKTPTLNVQKREDSATATKKPDDISRSMLDDRKTYEYLISVGVDPTHSGKIADKLLLKNVLVFFVKSTKAYSFELGLKAACVKVKGEIFSEPQMVYVLRHTRNNKMFFTSRKKRFFAKTMLLLLKIRMYHLAAFFACKFN